jgi:hypothetical protein
LPGSKQIRTWGKKGLFQISERATGSIVQSTVKPERLLFQNQRNYPGKDQAASEKREDNLHYLVGTIVNADFAHYLMGVRWV